MSRLAAFATPEARTRYEQAYDATLATAGVEVRARDVPTAFGATHVVEAGDAGAPPLVLLHTTKHVAELEQPERVNQLIVDHVAARA